MAGDDPYVYPGTDVLRNTLGVRDAGELAAVEANITALRAAELIDKPLAAATTWRTCAAFTATCSATSTTGPASCARW